MDWNVVTKLLRKNSLVSSVDIFLSSREALTNRGDVAISAGNPLRHSEGVKRLKNLGGVVGEIFEILRYAQNDEKGACS